MRTQTDVTTEEVVAVPRVLPTFDELIATRPPVFAPPPPNDDRLVVVLAALANVELLAIITILLTRFI